MIENLERRELYSVTYDADSTSVRVTGDDADDVVSVSRRGGSIVVVENGTRHAFDEATVAFVQVEAGGGDDRVSAARLDRRLVAHGQAGDNTIVGGAGDDLLYGGPGANRIFGRRGADQLNGGAGAELLDGGAGDDRMEDASAREAGGRGDVLLGRAGDDAFTYRGDAGLIDGGAGGDSVDAPAASARLVVRRVEGHNWYQPVKPPEPSDPEHRVDPATYADPAIHLYASRAADGTVTAWVEAIHYAGGFAKQFGDLQRTADDAFAVEVTGTDLAGPGAIRTQALEVTTRPYELGKLEPGVYSFTVTARGHSRARMDVRVTAAGLVDTPVKPGPYSERDDIVR